MCSIMCNLGLDLTKTKVLLNIVLYFKLLQSIGKKVNNPKASNVERFRKYETILGMFSKCNLVN